MDVCVSCSSAGGTNSLRDPDRRSGDSRGSRVDSGSVDMETPQSLSPRSPLDNLEALDGSHPPAPSSPSSTKPMSNGSVSSVGSAAQSHRLLNTTISSQPPLVNGHGIHFLQSSSNNTCIPSHSGHNNTSNNNNHVIISSPSVHPVPPPVPVLHPQPITISHSPGGSDSTHSLISDRRVPIVPPRRCRTRSPTPNTSHGKQV